MERKKLLVFRTQGRIGLRFLNLIIIRVQVVPAPSHRFKHLKVVRYQRPPPTPPRASASPPLKTSEAGRLRP